MRFGAARPHVRIWRAEFPLARTVPLVRYAQLVCYILLLQSLKGRPERLPGPIGLGRAWTALPERAH